MMYYYLFRPCVGRLAGREDLIGYMRRNLNNLIFYADVEKWFDVDQTTVSSAKDIDDILDFQNTKEITLIAFYISPYKRFFYYFLSHLKIKDLQDYELFPKKITTENFVKFWNEHKDKYVFNLADLYSEADGITIQYKLEYDTLVEDMRKIPGLESTPDSLVTDYQKVLAQYKEIYTDEIRQWVEEVCKKDIEMFGYQF